MHRPKAIAGWCAAGVIALALGCGGGGVTQQPTPKPPPPPGDKTPEKTIATSEKDMAPPIKGGTWFTNDGQAPNLKGKVYIAEFWSIY